MKNQRRFIKILFIVALVAGVLALSDFRYFVVKQYKNYQSTKIEDTTYEQIIIDANNETGQTKPMTGFLHGITYDNSQDYTETINLLNELKPKSWRLAGYNNVYEFVVDVAGFSTTKNTLITIVLQDLFNEEYGHPIKVDSACSTAVDSCFASYTELKDTWASFADKFMKKVATDNIQMNYFDVFAEPNWGWEGVSGEQLLELFKIAHDIARSYQPSIKIVAPSIGGIENNPDSFLKIFVPFLDYVVKNNLRVDAISWHEFASPEDVAPRVDEMRHLISNRPSLCNPTCPEIHINEYAGPESHLIPGTNVGFLYYFEKAGVDQINRACWDVVSRLNKWTTCWDGVNGMFLKDNVTTTNIYWVYRKYAEMYHARLYSEGSIKTIAIADRDDSKQELKVLVGRYGYNGIAGNVRMTIKNYPFQGSRVRAEIWKIPADGNKPTVLREPIKTESQILDVSNGSVDLSLISFKDGAVYYLILKPFDL